MSDETIKLGSTGEAVVKAQRELVLRYYLPPGSDDGTFGPITRNRALRYQLDRADHEYQSLSFPLDVDGVVGTKTWARLAPPVVKRNDEGDAVRLAQEILKHYGRPAYDPGVVDGKFGDSTETAVTNFQRDHSEPDGRPLDVDGVVGPRTWRALWS